MNAPSRGPERRRMAQSEVTPRPRVAVVMDDPLAKVLAVALRHGRYESQQTVDPAAFDKTLRDWRPHVVLIDLDAYPLFLKRSQEAESGAVPALVFTRRRDTALKLRAFQEGADD